MSPTAPDDNRSRKAMISLPPNMCWACSLQQERREVARRIETDKPFAQLVARWQQHFDPLNDQFDAVAAPQHLKSQIDHRLFATEPTLASSPLWNSVIFWRGLAFAALALAVIGFGRDLIEPLPNQPAAGRIPGDTGSPSVRWRSSTNRRKN